MMTLYNIEVSGNCHKIRLLLSFLNLNYDTYNLDISASEQHSDDYLKLNPFAQAPVLVDGDNTIRDSQAILVYLAKTYGTDNWWSEDAAELAHIFEWLSTAANEITYGPARIRAHYKFSRAIEMELATIITNKILTIVNQHLEQKQWLVNEKPTLADIAIYPYLALAHEGQIDLTPYPHIIIWMRRFESLPNYIGMPGIKTSTN